MPCLARVATVTHRIGADNAAPMPEPEPELCSYEAEIVPIVRTLQRGDPRRAMAHHATAADRGHHSGLDGTAARRDFGRAESAQGQGRRTSAEARLPGLPPFFPAEPYAPPLRHGRPTECALRRIEESRSKARAPLRGADRAADRETRPRVSSKFFFRVDCKEWL